jgi:hypothetical protein
MRQMVGLQEDFTAVQLNQLYGSLRAYLRQFDIATDSWWPTGCSWPKPTKARDRRGEDIHGIDLRPTPREGKTL